MLVATQIDNDDAVTQHASVKKSNLALQQSATTIINEMRAAQNTSRFSVS